MDAKFRWLIHQHNLLIFNYKNQWIVHPTPVKVIVNSTNKHSDLDFRIWTILCVGLAFKIEVCKTILIIRAIKVCTFYFSTKQQQIRLIHLINLSEIKMISIFYLY
jgi:hypothetical protein